MDMLGETKEVRNERRERVEGEEERVLKSLERIYGSRRFPHVVTHIEKATRKTTPPS
jgi:hypothetical protein